MRKASVAVVGGSGREGQALASTLCAVGYRVIVGSRIEVNAKASASNIQRKLAQQNRKIEVEGASNLAAVKDSDIVMLTIPYDGLKETLDNVGPALKERLITDIIVPYKLRSPLILSSNLVKQYRDHFGPGKTPSVTEEIFLYLQHRFKYKPHLVSALKTISFRNIMDLGSRLNQPILTWGFDSSDLQRIISLLRLVFPKAEIYEVPQMYWRSVEGVCELIRYMCLQGFKIDALNFSYA